MDELLSLIRHHELAESLQPFGLLVEPDGRGGLSVNAGRLDAGVQSLLEARGLQRISAATLGSDAAVAEFIAKADALIADSPSRFVLRQASAAVAPFDMPRSAEWLKRYYGKNGFSPFGERKPSVVDHARSGGPFISSIDDEPLVFFDASSQIATHAGGLNAAQVQRSRDEGGFDADLVVNRDSSREDCPALNALAELMLEHVHPSLNQVAFANSGAEANEKALNLARQHGRGGHRLLAMKGSFHGRTLLPLHGTWNPVKRGPFEFAGFEAKWVDFPRHLLPDDEPQMPAGWVESWRQGLSWNDSGDDALLSAELETLKSVDAQLNAEPIFAVITEVMQGEGGDNYATRRFFCALLALCRRHNVPLVIDEVQTGFGLGGPMFWHTSLRFEDAKGEADSPDLIASAKKAQLGAVISRFADDEPTEVSSASAVRGLAQARIALATDHEAMAALGESSLKALAAALPDGLITNVRGKGLAWGIDLPSGAVVNRLLAERFWRGYLTYIAGTHTLRFRLNPSMKDSDWQAVIDALQDNLKGLIEQVGWEGPQAFAEAVAAMEKPLWQASGSHRKPTYGLAQDYRLEVMTLDALNAVMPRVLELEAEVYEPQRRETAEGLCTFLGLPGFIGHLAFSANGDLAGFSLGAALEGFEKVDGCRVDATWGSGQTLYSLEMLVSAEHRGQGIGRMLKSAQFDDARSAGFRFISGRNRVGGTVEMAPLNTSLGAYTVVRLGAQYGEADGETDYYRLSLYPGRVDAETGVEEGIDLAGGLQRPMGNKPASLLAAARRGVFGGPLCNKLSLCNFATPDSVRFAELLQALAPQGCDHALYTSGRSEMVDKGLRAIKYANQQADVVLSFEGCYVGHTTAAARSVSDHTQPYFEWPKLPHPARVGCGAALDALDEALDEFGDRLLCLVIEPIGERSGLIIPSEFYAALQDRREGKGLRVSVCETVTGAFRNGYGSCFYVDSTELRADQVWWYAGGQLGVVFCADTTWVEKPLQLISTWDGDELCMIRSAHHLRFALRNQNAISQRAALMSRMLSGIGGASALGLCGHIPLEDSATVESELAKLGVQVRSSAAGITLLPPLSISADELGRGINAIVAL